MTRPPTNGISALAWDADGTIINSFPVAAAAYEDIAELFGPRPKIGTAEDRIAAWRSIPRADTTGTDGRPILPALHRMLMRDRAPAMKLFDNVIGVVGRLITRPALITASYAETAQTALKKHTDLFASIHGCEEGPKEQLMMEAAAAGVECYVCDTARDVERCRQVGVHSIGVTWGFDGVRRLTSARPDFIVHSASELAATLTRLGFMEPTPTPNHGD